MSPSRDQIRPATAQDMATITRIYAHFVHSSLATFDEVPPTEDYLYARFQAITSLGLPYLVVEEAGQVRGYAYASLYRDRSAYRYTVEDSIYIEPTAARRGYGRRLLNQLIEQCIACGKRQMVAVIGDADNIASINLHAALGFQRVATLPGTGFKFDRWISTVLMQCPLGDGQHSAPSS